MQLVAICVATLAQVGVLNWALTNISGICTKNAVNGFTCPFSRTHFNTSTIWGAVGPRKFFSADSTYHGLLYFLILGLVLPVLVFALKMRFPKSFWRHAHVPLLLGGLNYLPPASGTNYGSWAIVGLIFGVYIKRKHVVWWRRYTFVLSAALDSSIAIAAVIIFFAVFWTKASDHLNWWGTKVYKVGLQILRTASGGADCCTGHLRLEVMPLERCAQRTKVRPLKHLKDLSRPLSSWHTTRDSEPLI